MHKKSSNRNIKLYLLYFGFAFSKRNILIYINNWEHLVCLSFIDGESIFYVGLPNLIYTIIAIKHILFLIQKRRDANQEKILSNNQ